MRKFVLLFLSFILLIALLGTASSATSYWAFAHPQRLETWLDQSQIYEQVPTTVVKQAPSSVTINVDQEPVTVALDETTLNQAANSAFSPQLVKSDVNTFIDANYAWLEGKESSPSFQIDLSGPENSFGQDVAKTLESRAATLSACNATQLKQLGNTTFNLNTATCLPPGVNLQSISTQINSEVAGNTNVISSGSTLTANDLNSSNSNSKPYYQSVSWLPKAYQWAVKLPFILGGLSLFCILLMILVASPKRRAWRRLAWVFSEAGILLVIGWGITYFLFHKRGISGFSDMSNAGLQTALNNLVSRVSTDLSRVNLFFGTAYLGFAIILGILLLLTRSKIKAPKAQPAYPQPEEPLDQPMSQVPQQPQPVPRLAPSTSAPVYGTPRPTTTAPAMQPQRRPSQPPKRPKLIQ